jgi:hypothetical protein
MIVWKVLQRSQVVPCGRDDTLVAAVGSEYGHLGFGKTTEESGTPAVGTTHIIIGAVARSTATLRPRNLRMRTDMGSNTMEGR